MASAVDICNIALSRLGDTATVSSISPPEGSPQSQYCATFYPIARDMLLEMHQWTFTTRRAIPAQISFPYSQWKYAYAAPADMMDIISVLSQDATDDYSQAIVTDSSASGGANSGIGVYSPQTYSLETLDDGTVVILTNQENALLRYTARITDTTKFPAQFVDALSWLLASHLAGPLIKGDVGAKTAAGCYNAFKASFSVASSSDSNNQRRSVNRSVAWMVNR